MKPLYVGFYTPTYKDEAVECVATLDAFGLEHEFVPVESKGSWVANCAMKPSIISALMRRHPLRPLVYLDVDARVRQYPAKFDDFSDDDFGCHFFRGQELLSGTLYIAPSLNARWIISGWEIECERSPELWDQKVLERVLKIVSFAKVRRLPSRYCRIFDQNEMGDPVIEHMQASRRLASDV